MDKIKLNFGMFSWNCKCGNFINYKSYEIKALREYLEYAINPNIENQFFNYAFRCKRCGNVVCLRFDVVKEKEYFVIKNGGKL